MEVLGHPLTYPASCFINGGCGAAVFAHTNGNGDFVLLDSLGSPWPIHECYFDRFCATGGPGSSTPPRAYTDQEFAFEIARQNKAYKEAARRVREDRRRIPPQEIQRVSPESCNSQVVSVVGYVQSVVERGADRLLEASGGMAEQAARRVLGSRLSQITVVDSDFRSYTAFVDLSNLVVSKRTTVKVVLRRQWILGRGEVFVCELLDVFPIRPRQTMPD